jgi:putative spermidine/putrescine transport system substrate-binding protein
MALLADGVAPRDVYATLSSAAGLQRAFDKLDSLRPDLIWYDRDNDAPALIQDREAAFATALNQDASRAPHVIWDHQLYEFDAFAIPAGDSKKDLGMDYIRFASGSKPLAAVAEWQPLGPARRSGWSLVGKNPDLGTDLRPFLPTAHWDSAFAVDDEWWRIHGAAAEAAWRNWVH